MRPKLALRESWNFAELSVLKVPAPLTPEPINRPSRLSSAPYPHDPETFQASANVTQKKGFTVQQMDGERDVKNPTIETAVLQKVLQLRS